MCVCMYLTHTLFVLSNTNTRRYLVAAKILHKRERASELLREAVVMARFDHPNVLGLVGVCTRGEPVILLTQVCVCVRKRERERVRV